MLNFHIMLTLGGKKVHPFYRNILSRAAGLGYTPPSLTWQIKQNQLVYDLVGAGVWGKWDGFWNFYHDGSRQFSFINWINPTSTVGTEAGTLTFNSLDGIKQSGGGEFFDTQWSEAVNGINWQLGDSSFLIDIKENVIDTVYLCGAADGTSQYTRIRTRNTGDTYGVRINHPNNENTGASTDGSGIWFAGRLASAVEVWREGALKNAFTNTPAPARVTATHNVLRTNVSGSTVTTRTVRLYAVGARLAGSEAQIASILNNYKL